MPKVSTEETDSSVKKAPRKRAVRRTVVDGEYSVRRARSAAAAPVSTSSNLSLARKAPARVVAIEKRKLLPKIYITLGMLILALGAASLFGFSDTGQINVNALITERNQKQASDVTQDAGGDNVPQTIIVPVQNTAPTVPNAGLRGRGVGTPDISSESPAVVESEEATSSETSAEEITISEEGQTEMKEEEGTLELVQ